MIYLLLGAAVLVVLRLIRRTGKRRAAKRDALSGWLADYTPEAPSHLRDPEDGHVERGRL